MKLYIPTYAEFILALEEIRDEAYYTTDDDGIWMDTRVTLGEYIDRLINRYVPTEEEIT